MRTVIFEETQAEYAERLGVNFNWTRIWRRVLAAKFAEKNVEKRNDSVLWKLLGMSVDDFYQTLKAAIAVAGSQRVLVVPAPDNPDNRGLRLGQMYKAMSAIGFAWGGDGKPRTMLVPPYGYRTVFREVVFDDGEYHRIEVWEGKGDAGRAVRFAFEAILGYAAHALRYPRDKKRVGWKDIADDLNRQGFVRKDGEDWTNNDVRSLLRTPTYAGFGFLKARGFFRHEPILEPLVDPVDFVAAILTANASYNKIRHWFVPMLKVVGEVADGDDHLFLQRLIEASSEAGLFRQAFAGEIS